MDALVTWLFEEDSFAPAARLTAAGSQSVVADQLGTPLALYDATGALSWELSLDSYGGVRQGRGRAQDCPFRYQGQYNDTETGLYYNRFRYYDPEAWAYISQDLIRLMGGNRLHGYVSNPNGFVDPLGLLCQRSTNKFPGEAMPSDGKTKGVSGRRQFDFVVDQNGKLIIGDKYHMLVDRTISNGLRQNTACVGLGC